jgi:hypothetical protein
MIRRPACSIVLRKPDLFDLQIRSVNRRKYDSDLNSGRLQIWLLYGGHKDVSRFITAQLNFLDAVPQGTNTLCQNR